MRATASSSDLNRLTERLWEYEPTAILWEPDGALRAHKGAALHSALAAAQADDRMPLLLYDVFRTPDNERIIAIQAPENLDHSGNLEFYCGGELMPRQELARFTNNNLPLLAVQEIQLVVPPPQTRLCV